MESLGEALPREQKRCREVLEQYLAIGPAGNFGAIMIQQSLTRAEKAVMGGDLAEMIAAYNDLKEIK